MNEIFVIIYIKAKVSIYSFIAAYTATTMRYFKQKREGLEPTFEGWFYFGITSFLVTYTFFSFLEYTNLDIPENAKIALGFWVGYMSDFFYAWIPKYIKERLNTESKFFNNESFDPGMDDAPSNDLGGDNDRLHHGSDDDDLRSSDRNLNNKGSE